MQFSTLNESSLHHSLKILYSELYQGKTEVEKDGYVYDIVTKKGNVIEIQTQNLTKLLSKILATIENGHKIKLVYPLVINKTIELYDQDDKLISRRKSPVKGNLYDFLREITGLYPVLLNKSFSLEVVEINMTEERIKTNLAVQSKNHRRRYKKDWLKSNKRLEQIIDTLKFNDKKSYISLLPKNLPQEFSSKELKEAFIKEGSVPARIYNNSNLIIWIFSHMELIENSFQKGRRHYYKIK